MSRGPNSALRSRHAMEALAVMEFVKRKALLCWESAVGAKWRTHAWTVSASRRLHPWIRVPMVLVTDTVAWVLLVEVGISLVLVSIAWVYFYGIFFLAPYLSVVFWLLSYFIPPIWNLSHPPPNLTTLFAACSTSIFCVLWLIQRWMNKKDPGLELGDFITSFLERLPSVQQLIVGYIVFSLGSACAAVFTVDILLSVYWGFFGTIYLLEICCLMLYRLPWYVFVPAGFAIPLSCIGLFRKFKSSRKLAGDREWQMLQRGSFRSPISKLPV